MEPVHCRYADIIPSSTACMHHDSLVPSPRRGVWPGYEASTTTESNTA